ncbi:MAG: DUF2804 domain-containing protein [Eggerthellaceae bacterium]|nr:DUF2804 domain-containing protein [Eggerthellaceae bacterium]
MSEKANYIVNERGEHQIVQGGPLLGEDGSIVSPGFAYNLVYTYNREGAKVSSVRIKEWDYYLINDGKRALALTLGDLDYLGMLSASVMDFETMTYKTTSEILPLPLGSYNLPRDSSNGVSAFKNKRVDFRFEATPLRRILDVSFAKFDGDEELSAHVELDNIPRDSMVIATPWKEDKHAFYYNQKIVGMRAEGSFFKGGVEHVFDKEDSFGLLDWGRGVWTRDNMWYWGVAQGWQNGHGDNGADAPDKHVFAFNIGYGFGDTSLASENMVFVDGIAHKIGRLDFGIPKTDKFDTSKTVSERFYLNEPWHIKDEEGRFDMIFTPQMDRVDCINFGVIITDQHQVYGLLNGYVILDDSTKFEVKDLRGSAEVVRNKY